MLTARDAIEDRVRGLDGGADDYLTKPFSLAELLARLRALARRGPVERPAVLEVGACGSILPRARSGAGDAEIDLSAREFALLEAFMRRPGQVLSHGQLLEAAWDLGYEQRSNVVEVYVRYLREKIDRPFGVRSLETVRGMGYRLRQDGGPPEPPADPPPADRRSSRWRWCVVLAGAGLFVYLRLRADLDEAVDAGAPRARRGGRADARGAHPSAGAGGGQPEEGFAQVLAPGARVLDATRARAPVLTRAEIRRARAVRCGRAADRRDRGHGARPGAPVPRRRPRPSSWSASRSTIATRRSRAGRPPSPSAGPGRPAGVGAGLRPGHAPACGPWRRCAGARPRCR